MSQSTVINLLEKNPTWLTAKQIAVRLKAGEGSVRNNLRVLKGNGEIKFKYVGRPLGGRIALYKIVK